MRSIVVMGSVLLALVGGCGSPSASGGDAGGADVGSSTDGDVDAGASTDGATSDAATTSDAGADDAAATDAGSATDAGATDAGTSDAGTGPDTGAPVDAGGARTFACGPTDACVIDNEYCHLVTGGAPPGIMSYSCIALPATCTGRGVTRSCATCFPSGTPGGVCTDLGPGELQVTLLAP